MRNVFHTLAQAAVKWYSRSEELIEDEMEFAIPSSVVNNLIQQWVTDNVDALSDLHTELNDGWLRIFATVHYRSLQAQLCCDAKIIAFEFNKDAQFIVFEQVSRTRVLHLSAAKWQESALFKLGLWFGKYVLRQDLLGRVLQRLDIATLENDLIHIDIHCYITQNYRALSVLEKIQINQAYCKQHKLVLRTNVNLYAVLGMQQSQKLFSGTKLSKHA